MIPIIIYTKVQFKRTIRYFTWPFNIMQIQVQIGDFVIVQADRGEDLGIVTDTLTTQAFMDRRYQMKAYMDEEDQTIGCILRVANPSERKLLTENFHDERLILKVSSMDHILIYPIDKDAIYDNS